METSSEFYAVEVGAPQGNIIGYILYMLFSAYVPSIAGTAGTFCIMASNDSQIEAVVHLQQAVDKVSQRSRVWKRKLPN